MVLVGAAARRHAVAASGVAALALVLLTIHPALALLPLAAAFLRLLCTRTEFPPVAYLSLYVAALTLISARYAAPQLGAVGTLSSLLGLLAMVWWTYTRVLPGLGGPERGTPVRGAVLFFVAALALAYANGFTRGLTPLEVQVSDRAMILLFALVGVALVAEDGIRTRQALDRLLERVVLLVAFVAIAGILQFLFSIDLSTTLRPPGFSLQRTGDTARFVGEFFRVTGTTLHPIEFGVILGATLPLALHYGFHCPQDRRLIGRWWKVGVIVLAIPMSVSRSAVVAVAVSMGVMSIDWSWRRRSNMIVAAALFAVMMRSAIPGLLGTLKSLVLNASTDPSITGRAADYEIVGQLIASSPWLGRGFGTYVPEQYIYLDNQYLGTLVEAGILGLIGLVTMIVVAICCARGARRREGATASTRSLGQALAAFLFADLATFGTFDALGFPMNAGLLFVMIGSAGALWRLSSCAEAPAPARGAASSSTQPHLWVIGGVR